MKKEKNSEQTMLYPVVLLISMLVGAAVAHLLEASIGMGILFGMSFGFLINGIIMCIKSRIDKK